MDKYCLIYAIGSILSYFRLRYRARKLQDKDYTYKDVLLVFIGASISWIGLTAIIALDIMHSDFWHKKPPKWL